ncbi:MAG: hypothetical protein SWY16_01525 [Cyanobacteriota bacterium]|nr:hypothetical protein [Cyanobacteriota bacterium]
MILSRRNTHFYAIVALACALPLVFLAGLLWRPSFPTVDETTNALFAAADFSSGVSSLEIATSETLSVGEIDVLAETSKSPAGELFLDLQPTQALEFSDVLVYWSTARTETVSNEAILLGQLSGTSRRHFRVPSQIQGKPGYLLFYSRAQDTAIASVPLPQNF